MERNNNTTQVSFFPLILEEMDMSEKNYDSLHQIINPALYNENWRFQMILCTALLFDTFFFYVDKEGNIVVKEQPKGNFYVCERIDKVQIKEHYVIGISRHLNDKDELLGVFLFSQKDICVKQVLSVKYSCYYEKDNISNARYIQFRQPLRSLQSDDLMIRDFVTALEAINKCNRYEESILSKIRQESTLRLDFLYTKRYLAFEFLAKNFIQN